jgi:pyruvate,water dikinase
MPPPDDGPLVLTSSQGWTDDQLVQVIGGKALNLYRLSNIFPPASVGQVYSTELGGRTSVDAMPENASVPPFFAVTTHAFNRFITYNNLLPSIRLPPSTTDFAAHAEKVHSLVVGATMPPEVEQEVRDTYMSLFSGDAWVAVRSSGTDEDSSDNSFAGQYESFLFQRGADMVLSALKLCWASAFSERVFASRVRAGLVPEASRMGVVVQRMLTSDVSGKHA